MKPAPFAYHMPDGLEELLELADEHGDTARVLAGGQSLMPLLNARRIRLRHLIDLNEVAGLDYLRATDATLAVGALVRQARALSAPEVSEAAPLVADALQHVASPTVRNRGTVCGSIAFANPSAELPAVALAMGGDVVARHVDGERRIGFDEFFVGPFATALRPGEVITEVRLTRWAPDAGHAFLEVDRMRWPVVSVAALVELDGEVVSRCAIALAGAAGTPIRDEAAELALVGAPPTEDAIAYAADALSKLVEAADDAYGTAAYRRHIARVLVQRAFTLAAERATEAAA
jgi:carbon-monoxide dehydrogenase medium subunit